MPTVTAAPPRDPRRGPHAPAPGAPARSRYPRRGAARALRTVLLFCWSLIVAFFVRDVFALLELASRPPADLADPAVLLPALLIPLPEADTPPALAAYAGGVLAFLGLLAACVWATVDVERERRAVRARELGELLGAGLPAVVREQVAAILREVGRRGAPAAPQGPPFDEALLPVPDAFVGREADLEWLLARLRAGRAAGVSALGGMGGIGKTTLVAVALRRVRAEGRFPDGVAVVLCQEMHDAAEVLRRTLARFDPERRQPEASDPAGLAEAARRLLEGKDALVVLDNVEPELDVRLVVTTLRGAGAALLLTARQSLPHTVVPVEAARILELLPARDALDLFARAAGRASAEDFAPGERAAAERIVAALGRHTLAVKLAGAYAADLHRDLAALARELEQPERAIALPSGETPRAVALAFAESTEALPAATRRLFAALAAFATPEFSREAALAVGAALGMPAPEAGVYLLVLRALLRAAADETLPPGADRERLRLHPLLRAFAASEFADWPEAERAAAERAIARYYAEYARRAPDLALAPDEENIVAALEWAHARGEAALVAALCDGLSLFWRDRWRAAAALRYLPWGIAAAEEEARESGDAAARLRAANLALTYGQVLRRTGNLEEAGRTFAANLALRRELGDRQGEGWVLMQLGYIALRRGALDEAEPRFAQALDLFRATGDRENEGEANGYLGQIALRRGDFAAGERAFEAALALFRAIDDRQGEGWALARLGRTARLAGRFAEAEERLGAALAVQRAAGDRQGEGVTLAILAEAAAARGRPDEAEGYYRESLRRLRDVQDALHTASAARDFGALLIERPGRREEGAALLAEAVRLYARMGLPEEAETREQARRLGIAV